MKSTGYNDRNGRAIMIGDTLKWIREPSYFKGGSKKGQLKQEGAEFIAGKVVELPPKVAERHDIKYWCRSLEDTNKRDPWSELPGGLRFTSMLDYIEVVENISVA